MADMVVINGVRYRVEDAKRLGLIEPEPKKKKAANKARTAKNKGA